MKHPILKFLLLTLIAVWLLFSCKPVNPPVEPPVDPNEQEDPKDDDDNPPVIDTDLNVSLLNVVFQGEKDACLVVVRTKDAWTATTSDSWLSLSSQSGAGNTGFLIGASRNEGFARQGSVLIKAGTKSQTIQITQQGASMLKFTINDVVFNMILVEGGKFMMGDDYLTHQVQLSDFYIAETETTRELWQALMGDLSEVQKVKLKAPNELGLYDMSGNVAEWCSDWYDSQYGMPVIDGVITIPELTIHPTGPESGTEKVMRGGSRDSFDWNCRVSSRNYRIPSTETEVLGFRMVLSN